MKVIDGIKEEKVWVYSALVVFTSAIHSHLKPAFS
jgi:hypothetical protein